MCLSEPLLLLGAKAGSPSQDLVALAGASFLKEQSLGGLGDRDQWRRRVRAVEWTVWKSRAHISFTWQ